MCTYSCMCLHIMCDVGWACQAFLCHRTAPCRFFSQLLAAALLRCILRFLCLIACLPTATQPSIFRAGLPTELLPCMLWHPPINRACLHVCLPACTHMPATASKCSRQTLRLCLSRRRSHPCARMRAIKFAHCHATPHATTTQVRDNSLECN